MGKFMVVTHSIAQKQFHGHKKDSCPDGSLVTDCFSLAKPEKTHPPTKQGNHMDERANTYTAIKPVCSAQARTPTLKPIIIQMAIHEQTTQQKDQGRMDEHPDDEQDSIDCLIVKRTPLGLLVVFH